MMDSAARPEVAAVGLHLTSTAPWGPVDGGQARPGPGDGCLGIDFHLIDNLVHLFAESYAGPGEWQQGAAAGSRGCRLCPGRVPVGLGSPCGPEGRWHPKVLLLLSPSPMDQDLLEPTPAFRGPCHHLPV